MKLDFPLANLVGRCQTICVPYCCGIDAYDFSPVNIASYLTMYRGEVDTSELQSLRDQLHALKSNYGVSGTCGNGATFEEMNTSLTAAEIDDFADTMLANLDVATKLVEISEAQRYKDGRFK